MALSVGDQILQKQGQIVDGFAQTIQDHAKQFTASVTDLAQYMGGTTATAYHNVSANTLIPQLSAFETALRNYGYALTHSGIKLEAAEEANLQRLNSVGATAEHTASTPSWNSNLNF